MALAGCGYAALVQLQSYFLYAPRSGDVGVDALLVLRAPLIGLQFALAAALLALLYRALAGSAWGAWLFWSAWLAHQLLLTMGQLCYRLFGGVHVGMVQAELTDGRLPLAWRLGMALELLGWPAVSQLVALGLLTAWLVASHRARAEVTWPAPDRLPGAARRVVFAAYVVPAALLLGGTDNHGLETHPLVGAASSLTAPAAEPAYSHLLAARLERPAYDRSAGPQGEADALATALSALRVGERPNLVFVVLESVGTLQLIAHRGPHAGRISPQATPFLAGLARSSVRFDALYPSFPGSARSHISMMSGGPTITWGDYDQFLANYTYRAPSFISELQARGYAVGVFAAGDLQIEHLADYYRGLGPDALVHYNDAAQSMDQAAKLNYWGVSSDEARRVAVEWVRQLPAGQPYALMFHTVETHHPYDWPESHPAPLEGFSLQEKYYNALHYTDAALRRLWGDLQGLERGRTLLALTGDHGQAFGKRHPGNFIHRNHLYEENLRVLLLIADARLGREVVSSRVGQIGDVGPTVLAALDSQRPRMPGQNLFAASYRRPIVYFHKVIDPYRWGLRDGRWKYVGGMRGEEPLLFDLTTDPLERHNLARERPDQVRLYHELCATWYVKMGYDWADALKLTLPPDQRIHRAQLDVRPWGALGMRFGLHPGGELDPDVPIGRPRDAFTPGERVIWRVRWVPWRVDQRIDCVVVPPRGTPLRFSFRVPAHARFTVSPLPVGLPRPLAPGRYTIRLSLASDQRPLISATFDVGER